MSKDYIELEYLKTTGTQYVELNYLTKSNTGFEITVTIDPDTGANLFGAGISSNSTHPYFNLRENMCKYSYYNGDTAYMVKFSNTDYNNIHTYKFIKNSSTYNYYYDSTHKGSLDVTHPAGANWVLFSYRETTGSIRTALSEVAKCSFYNMKIYESANVVMDLIPVKRKTDNIICLYDKIGNQYYLNSGSGEFIAGPEILDPTLYDNIVQLNTMVENCISLTKSIIIGINKRFPDSILDYSPYGLKLRTAIDSLTYYQKVLLYNHPYFIIQYYLSDYIAVVATDTQIRTKSEYYPKKNDVLIALYSGSTTAGFTYCEEDSSSWFIALSNGINRLNYSYSSFTKFDMIDI